MATVRDFIYLDVPRLQSFASQLFQGLPESRTKTDSHGTEFGGQLRGGVPLVVQASADTKAVLSASSTITSTLHHQLVVDVLTGLREQRFLVDDVTSAEDGQFVLLSGQLQVIDPEALAEIVQQMPDLGRHIRTLTSPTSSTVPTRADRRAGRVSNPQSGGGPTSAQADAMAAVLQMFAKNTVRLRVFNGHEPIAVAVVERDKFVEQLDRLVLRHGYRMAGTWHILGQVNIPAEDPFYAPEGETLLDIVEREALMPMKQVADISGAGPASNPLVTPLAIYREIEPTVT